MTIRGEKVCQFIELYCLIPDKQAYKPNKRRMAWTALGMMIVSIIAVLIDPARIAKADAVLMMMYGSLSALVGTYFGCSGGTIKSDLRACVQAYAQLVIPSLTYFALHCSVFAVVATTVGYGE